MILTFPLRIDILEKIKSNVPQFNKLTEEQIEFVKENLFVDADLCINIESSTVNQSGSDRWFKERKKRITASNFGAVINRRPTVYPNALLKKLFQTKKVRSKHCDWGIENEKVAIKQYVDLFPDSSSAECGLIINPKYPWLGASPDGIITKGGESYLIEVKCPSTRRDFMI